MNVNMEFVNARRVTDYERGGWLYRCDLPIPALAPKGMVEGWNKQRRQTIALKSSVLLSQMRTRALSNGLKFDMVKARAMAEELVAQELRGAIVNRYDGNTLPKPSEAEVVENHLITRAGQLRKMQIWYRSPRSKGCMLSPQVAE